MNDDERDALMRVYLDVFSTQNGDTVLRDLERVYRDRQSMTVEAEVAAIPHPWRAYYVEGQRSVVRALRDLVEATKGDA